MDKKKNVNINEPGTIRSQFFVKSDLRNFEKTFEGEKYEKLTVEQARELLSSRLQGKSLSEIIMEERNS